MTEGKKQKQKRKRRLPSNGPNSPRQPGPGKSPSSSSRQPGCCRRGEHAGDAWPPPASPRPPLDAWRLPDVLPFHSPPPELPPPPPVLVSVATRERRRSSSREV